MTVRKRHQERRWEWMLMPGEEPEALLQDDTIRAIIAPYTNAEHVNIYRKRVYNFHAIIADRWQTERVFLAGDAAHMTPPFAGQGLNSGFRDVRNLSWKLASVIKGQADAGVLQSYEAERRDHAHQLIETALELGRQIQPIDPKQAADRDAFFAEIQQSPEGVANFRKDMLQSVRARAIDRGLVVDAGEDPLNGQLLIQPRLNSVSARNFLMDEELGSGFALVGFNCDPRTAIDQDALAYWMDQGARLVAVSARGAMAHDHWLEDAYGELGRWIGDREHCLLLIRPDRFCMVAFTSDNAVEKLAKARQLLSAGEV
jgi:3-(3-hydroxy-phenyl)propionate hydroxylase